MDLPLDLVRSMRPHVLEMGLADRAELNVLETRRPAFTSMIPIRS